MGKGCILTAEHECKDPAWLQQGIAGCPLKPFLSTSSLPGNTTTFSFKHCWTLPFPPGQPHGTRGRAMGRRLLCRGPKFSAQLKTSPCSPERKQGSEINTPHPRLSTALEKKQELNTGGEHSMGDLCHSCPFGEWMMPVSAGSARLYQTHQS